MHKETSRHARQLLESLRSIPARARTLVRARKQNGRACAFVLFVKEMLDDGCSVFAVNSINRSKKLVPGRLFAVI